MTFGQIALAWLLIGTCLLLMLVILLQRGRGGGLAGAFGGGGGSSAFGAKTGDVFTWITVVLAGLFVTLAVVANFVFEPAALASPVEASLNAPVPATPIQIPVGGDQAGGKIELISNDGEIIPINAKMIPEGQAPGTKAVEPAADLPKTEGAVDAERKPVAAADNGTGADNDGGDEGGQKSDKDPGK